MDSFTHLHVHSEYSILDGHSKIDDIVQAAVEDGQPAISTTDHGNMYAIIPMYQACERAGIKYIPGEEFYMAKESVTDRPKPKKKSTTEDGEDERGEKLYYHLTMLAENNTGYQNLIKLSSRAYLDGYYYKPRTDWEMLAEHSEGVIATTGCLGGVVLQELLHGEFDNALEKAARLQDIFGRDNLFVELQDHGLSEQIRTNPQLIEIASTLDAPLLAANDSHYTTQRDHHSHGALLCINTGSMLSDPNRFKFDGDQHYIKSAAEMRHLFSEIPEACDNTLWIAERSNVEIEFGKFKIPKFIVPEGFTDEEQYLRALVARGAEKRYGGGSGSLQGSVPDNVSARLSFELDTICSMGFAGYFLINWDLIRHARETGITVGFGRGSVGGSVVAYCLGIIQIDPIRYNLLFERFLNPSRVSMPDIDTDYDSRYRDHMINYVTAKYGDDKVAQIVTFNQIKSRQAVRDASRVLGYPYDTGNKLAKALPPLLYGRDTPLRACLVENEKHAEGYRNAEPFRQLYESGGVYKEVIDVALGLEGMRKSEGVHPAAVVISPDPLTDHVPLRKSTKGPITTQYEMHAVEELGLLKMDFLGLRNLDVLADTAALIKSRHGIEIDFYNPPEEDGPTYDLLGKSNTIGVFQLESPNMRALLRQMKPQCFDDVAACIALYRPGPMAANMHSDYAERLNGRQPIRYFHPDAEDILRSTQGLCLFQEQVLEIAQKFAGFTVAHADILRRAMGKKIQEEMEAQREAFVDGCVSNGYPLDFSSKLFDLIDAFSSYGFNRSHSYGYAMISYSSAYFKANYPVEYMSALLTSVQTKAEKLAPYLTECNRMGLDVLPPDINTSGRNFVPKTDRELVFGFLGIRNIGEDPSQDIIAARQEPYVDFHDFVDKVSSKTLNKRVLDSLIAAGCFDSLGHPRLGLSMVQEGVVKDYIKRKKEQEYGVMTLFNFDSVAVAQGIPDEHYEPEQLLALEKEYLGVYLTDHPLNHIERLEHYRNMLISDVNENEDGLLTRRRGKLVGVITSIKRITTKKGDAMRTFQLEDTTGTIDCVLFPRQTAQYGQLIEEGSVISIEGTLEDEQDKLKILVDDVQALKRAPSTDTTVHVSLPLSTPVEYLKDIISKAPGNGRVIVHFGNELVRLPEEYKTSVSSLIAAMEEANV